MFQLLDIAWPGRPRHPRIIIDTPIDSIPSSKPTPDSLHSPDTLLDTLSSPQELLDTLTNKEAVLDTLRSAMNFFTNFGANNGQSSSLQMTALIVMAALTLCGGFVWMYRRNLTRQGV